MLRLSLAILFVILFTHCNDSNTTEPDGPLELNDIVGSYSLSELTKTENGETLDLLAIGVRISIILKSDNTLEGTFFTPDTLNLLEEGAEGDLNLDLTGTYSFYSDKVEMQVDMDLYFNDATWTVDGKKMYTEDIVHTVFTKE